VTAAKRHCYLMMVCDLERQALLWWAKKNRVVFVFLIFQELDRPHSATLPGLSRHAAGLLQGSPERSQGSDSLHLYLNR